MVTESYNVRERCVPSSNITQVLVKHYEVKDYVDEDGITHKSVQEINRVGFLDVPFRDYSMATYQATGEVSRLHVVSPQNDNSLDMYDRISGDLDEISAKIDHFEMMESLKQSSEETKQEPEV